MFEEKTAETGADFVEEVFAVDAVECGSGSLVDFGEEGGDGEARLGVEGCERDFVVFGTVFGFFLFRKEGGDVCYCDLIIPMISREGKGENSPAQPS